MKRNSTTRAACAALALAQLSAAATAQVYSYTVAKSIGYTQTSNVPPAAPDAWLFTAQVYYGTPYEVLSAEISFDMPPLVAYDFFEAGSFTHQYYSSLYGTEVELDAGYPSTTYAIAIDRGAGVESSTVFLPVGLYPPEIPHFTLDTYDRLQAYDVSQPFGGTVNAFALAAGTTYGATQLSLAQEGIGGVWSFGLTPSETAFEVPAGLLLPDTNYSIGVQQINGVETPNAGFGGASALAEFSRGTAIYFRTGPATPPCPGPRGDANCDAAVDFFDIDPFLLALFDHSAYLATYCGGTNCAADVDQSGTVDFFDIDPFLACLFGACP